MINMRDIGSNMTMYSLNGLRERWELTNLLDQLTAQSKAMGRKFTVMFIRLETRKKNDVQAQKFNTEISLYAASTLRLSLSDNSCQLFYYDNREIVGVFIDADKKDIAFPLLVISKNFRHRPFLFKNRLYSVKVKIGIAAYPKDGLRKEELLRAAIVSCATFRLKSYRFLYVMNKFVKPLAAGIACLLIGAGLFFVWSRLDIDRLKSSVAKALLGSSVPAQAELVKVITKGGSMFRGFLISETQKELVVSAILDKGQATMTFSKDEVIEVLRGKNAL